MGGANGRENPRHHCDYVNLRYGYFRQIPACANLSEARHVAAGSGRPACFARSRRYELYALSEHYARHLASRHAKYAVSPASLDAIAAIRSCCKRQELCRRGNAANTLYRVLAGAALAFIIQSYGRRQIVDLLLPGDFFGFAPGTQYDYSVETVDPARWWRNIHASKSRHWPTLTRKWACEIRTDRVRQTLPPPGTSLDHRPHQGSTEGRFFHSCNGRPSLDEPKRPGHASRLPVRNRGFPGHLGRNRQSCAE